MEFISEYGLFLAKTVTLVIAIVVIIAVIAASRHKNHRGELAVKSLSDHLREIRERMQGALLDKSTLKKLRKEQKKARKEQQKETRRNVYVIDFKGSVDAHEVAALREEVTGILTVADPAQDEVLVRLESPGGVVHGYGLAASQLARLRAKGIKLTIAVDKVAASGGYMMACVADHIISAPFAIIGSIGVVAQMPNFNRLLKQHNVDVEMHTAGEYKRTLTMFGENTEEGRQKFREELAECHQLFKGFVGRFRPQLDIDNIATGEHWFGEQALGLQLVDELQTSDDYLLNVTEQANVYQVRFITRKKISDKVADNVSSACTRLFSSLRNNYLN